MDVFIPETILDDYERMAKMRAGKRTVRDNRDRLVSVHANVLLGLIRTYRAAREQEDKHRRGL